MSTCFGREREEERGRIEERQVRKKRRKNRSTQ
jgi:hypothetical protein